MSDDIIFGGMLPADDVAVGADFDHNAVGSDVFLDDTADSPLGIVPDDEDDEMPDDE